MVARDSLRQYWNSGPTVELTATDLVDVDVVIVQHPEKRLQLLYVVAVPLEQILVLLYLVGVVARLLLLPRAQSLDLRLELVDLRDEATFPLGLFAI